MSHTVGELARLAGITVRTLHHYDRIGLLTPSGRTPAGYRVYELADVDRLHQVLVYRGLGFGLEEIAALLDDPDADAGEHLRRQHRLLLEQRDRTDAMVAAVEKEMEALAMGNPMTPQDKLEVFGDWLPEQYADEAEQRWGDTEAWSQSQARTGSYTKADWLEIKAETDDLERRLAAAVADGAPADGERAMDLAEEHRQQITRRYYDCSPELHACLGRMYTEDERFTAYYERVAPGLAAFLATACQANAARQG
ncbi:MerR family transcriptional regulator [Klenkia taihuensis]|uniref:DNA-binding transcriptional regulator, MerR family n=1 Tax=Klenkia taihuensis TaxID=1225127 RepID=A0A1I1P6N1_9ACTN|nr:MerR family transcriptional regulator [Klenkia taihuensis]GHE11537.1 HTH-type transcriptional activator TipA [Klenkia taihuensis]SFD03308.1 DNA-binding transcriptional regulator, MerR family [Klenkia taihuensis]